MGAGGQYGNHAIDYMRAFFYLKMYGKFVVGNFSAICSVRDYWPIGLINAVSPALTHS